MPAAPITRDHYAKIDAEASRQEAALPFEKRTRFTHEAGADAVAIAALSELAGELEEAGSDLSAADVVTLIRARVEQIAARPLLGSPVSRAEDMVSVPRWAMDLMAPAYGVWVTRNSPLVTRRLEALVGADTSEKLLTEFYIAPKRDR